MSEPAPVNAPVSLSGNLHLVCSAHPERGTFISGQSFSAPIHVSKAYWNGDTLLINVINPTAGIFGGDTIMSHVVVEPGARVLLTSPSAARFHPSQGRESRVEQRFEIRAGGCLDVYPEISIPQRESRSFQKNTIEIEPAGELIYLETLAPGRVASGETFAFAKYAWATDIRVGGQLIHRERASIVPGDTSVSPLRALFHASYYAGVILVSPEAEKWQAEFPQAVAAIAENPAIKMGASKLNAHGWSIRLLAENSLVLQASLKKLRTLIYQRLNRSLPDTRRNGL